MKLIQKATMKQCRKEHVAILINSTVYAIGGYDATENQFIKTCEKYDIEKDVWESIQSMKIAKCAFAAT